MRNSENNIDADILLLAAGFGTRLRPLTETTPKPLLAVAGKPLIDWNLERIAREGFARVIINVHHLGQRIIDYVGDGSRYGLSVVYSVEDPILDTGGAIRKIEPLLRHQTLLTINSDTALGPDFSLRGVLKTHLEHKLKPVISCVVQSWPDPNEFGALGLDKDGRVVSFLGVDYLPGCLSKVIYLGVQAIDRSVLANMPPPGSIFSITRDIYKKILVEQGVICSICYEGYFSDVGTPDRLEAASNMLSKLYGEGE